jgi:NB-ARC domain
VHLSNASSHSIGPTQGERSERTPNYAFGLNLAEAPQIDEALFVGREVELEELQEWLYSSKGRRKVVAVSGLGGIGKTQLSVHFAKRCQGRYSSVFWLNAKDESSLKTGLVNLAIRLADEGPSPARPSLITKNRPSNKFGGGYQSQRIIDGLWYMTITTTPIFQE